MFSYDFPMFSHDLHNSMEFFGFQTFPASKHPMASAHPMMSHVYIYGTTNTDAGVGIGMKRGDSKIWQEKAIN